MSWWSKHVTKNVSKATKQLRKSVTGTMRNIEKYTGIDEINRFTQKTGLDKAWDYGTVPGLVGIDMEHAKLSKVTEEYWRGYENALDSYTNFYEDMLNFSVPEAVDIDGGEELTTTSNEAGTEVNTNKVRNARLGASYSLGNTNSQAGQRRTGGYVGGRTTGGYGGKKSA